MKTTNDRGITLIALVITIIVMLILVAVTINMAVNGGLFGYAGNATRDTKTAKDEEQDWANVESNLTTEQLIAKYTTNKAEDLKKLKRFYIDEDETAIPDWGNSIINIVREYRDMTRNSEIIKYNNNLYRVTDEFEDETRTTTVEALTGEDLSKYMILSEGSLIKTENFIAYYDYNNNLYKVTEAEGEGKSTYIVIEEATAEEILAIYGVTVTYNGNGQSITFVPKTNQTWYSWATDSDYNGIDIDLSDCEEGLTLKQLIIQKNNQEDKHITVGKWLGGDKEGPQKFDLFLFGQGGGDLTTTNIIRGDSYVFWWWSN